MKTIILFFFVFFSLLSCQTVKSDSEPNRTSEIEGAIDDSVGGWDFCTCVVAIDSITFAIESDKLTVEQTDKLMQRWELVYQNCKEFTTLNDSAPQSREKYEKRVKKCLE